MRKIILVALVLALILVMALPMGNVMAGSPPDYPAQYYLAAHAVVVNGCLQETAWADCNNSQQFRERGSWAWYFSYPGNGDNSWGLFAGSPKAKNQNQIGRVTVTENGTTMTVLFETWGNWKMTETHLAVVPAESTPKGIPQTKSGNPKVGNFVLLDGEKSVRTFNPWVSTYTYVFNIP